MKNANEWNLTSAEIELLKVMANERDHSDRHLAAVTGYKESTIKAVCHNIEEKMGVHQRGCAVLEAVRNEIVSLAPPSVIDDREREREREASVL